MHCVKFHIHHLSYCSFIADTGLLLQGLTYCRYHTAQNQKLFSLHFIKYSLYRKSFKIKVVDLSKFYYIYAMYQFFYDALLGFKVQFEIHIR